MTEDEERFATLKTKLDERQMAEKFEKRGIDHRIEQAQSVALGILNHQDGETESVEDTLKMVETCVAVLDECVQVLGGSDVEVIASFPEGRRSIVNLSR